MLLSLIFFDVRYANYYYDEYPLPAPALYDYGYGDDYGTDESEADEGVSGDTEEGEGQDESGSDEVESSDDLGDDDGSSSSEELQPPQETW